MSYNISLNFSSILARLPGSRFLTLLRKGVYESPIDTLHPDATDVDELFVTESSLGGVDTPVAAAIDKLTSTPGAWAFFASGYMLGLLLMVSLTQSSFPNLICLEKIHYLDYLPTSHAECYYPLTNTKSTRSTYLPFPASFCQPFPLYIHLSATVILHSTIGFISHNHSPCLAFTFNIFLMQDASRLVPPYIANLPVIPFIR